jgi:hypothetical protein
MYRMIAEPAADIPLPARAYGIIHQRSPKLEETLLYFLTLLRTDCVDSGKGAPELWKEVGMEKRRFQRHLNHPDWKLARGMAQKHKDARTREATFGAYVFKHLSEEAKKVWEELQFWAEHDDAQLQITRLMTGRGRKVRQELFIHALVSTHYDISRALYLTGLSKMCLEKWIQQDLEFS